MIRQTPREIVVADYTEVKVMKGKAKEGIVVAVVEYVISQFSTEQSMSDHVSLHPQTRPHQMNPHLLHPNLLPPSHPVAAVAARASMSAVIVDKVEIVVSVGIVVKNAVDCDGGGGFVEEMSEVQEQRLKRMGRKTKPLPQVVERGSRGDHRLTNSLHVYWHSNEYCCS